LHGAGFAFSRADGNGFRTIRIAGEISSPTFSPDGKRIAFRRQWSERRSAIFVVSANGGRARQVVAPAGGVADKIDWSPDGSGIVFSAPVFGEKSGQPSSNVFTIRPDGSGLRQLTHARGGKVNNGADSWSPDGKQIAFWSMRGDRWDVEFVEALYELEVDAEGAEPRRLTEPDESASNPSFSPEGSLIAYVHSPEDGTYPHHGQIAVMKADGSDRRVLTESLDRQCAPFPLAREPVWDGDRVAFGVEDGGNVHLYTVAGDGSGEPELLVGGEQSTGLYDLVDGVLVYTASAYDRPHELFGSNGERITSVCDDFVAGRELADVERFTAKSADGTEVDAWLVRPPGFDEGKRYPTLVTIHGGPFSQYGTGFFDEVQVYAGAGYCVLFSNPRGGSGYSEEWGRAIRGTGNGDGPGWGSVDYEDVMGVVDTALEQFPFLDADRLGVLGGSYGGFLTSWIVGHTKRFKAALSERSVNHLVSAFGSSDLFWIFERQFGGPMWENVDEWLRMSPATYARDIETPLLVVHSENDLRCNIEQGEHLFTLLRLLGKEVEMLRFPAEGHELSRSGSPVHRVQRFEAILEWFGRYLAPGD